MGFYFRKVNTEATIVCVLNAEANPVKEQKHVEAFLYILTR